MHLNKGVIRNHYPTPNIEGIAPKFNKANVFSVFDQCKGRLPASSIQKFGFINGVDNVNWPPYRDSKS